VTAQAPAVDAPAVLGALEDVPDPEIPTVSIVELGMVGAIDVDPTSIRVELLPTFVGCPALEVIQACVASRLEVFDRRVEVRVSFSTPWTSARISPSGREKLRRSGFAPPPRSARSLPMLPVAPQTVACPYCSSPDTRLENAFGPTQCRSIRYCASCRQPFEAFKPV
jgi:ring-1,2-phenylacetyl-CoA epoxidase subunit PaaD